MGAVEEEKLKSEIELARAQTIKFRAEADSFRRPNLIGWIALITGSSALMTAIFGAYLQWRQSDAAIATAKMESQAKIIAADQKILAADEKTYKAERSTAETEDRRKVLAVEVEVLQNRIDLAKKEVEKYGQMLNQAAQTTSDLNAQKVLKQAASDAGSLASSINSNQPVTLNFRGGISSPMMEQLRSQFRSAGYPATRLLPRVRTEITNEVLYYQKEDEADARSVAAIAAGFFDGKCAIPREIPVRFRELNPPPDRIELFIYGNCERTP